MIATGNHNFERFAALCNTPGGSQGVQTISVYALLQGVCVHPGACGNPGLRAAISRPYRAYALNRGTCEKPGLRADFIRPYREGAFYFTLCFKK